MQLLLETTTKKSSLRKGSMDMNTNGMIRVEEYPGKDCYVSSELSKLSSVGVADKLPRLSTKS